MKSIMIPGIRNKGIKYLILPKEEAGEDLDVSVSENPVFPL